MQTRRHSPLYLALAGVIAATALTGCQKKGDPISAAEQADKKSGIAAPGIEETKAIAEEAFIYGLPIVMNYAIMHEFNVDPKSGQYKGPFNKIANEARVFTSKDTAVVTPNSDTPYSMLWLDLRAEPRVISVPAFDNERYYSVQLCDGNTFNYGYIGNRATGIEAADYLVVGPDWQGETPAGIKKVFQSSTQFSIAIFRTQLFNAEDMPNVMKIQTRYKTQPLSAFLKQPAPPAAPKPDFLPATTRGIKENFFAYLDYALQFNPPAPEEHAIRAKLASIGIGEGKTFELKDLSLEHQAAVLLGMKAGDDKVKKAVAQLGTEKNGWRISAAQGDRAFYNGNWLLRAAAAQAGIYGNDSIEATYPITRVDAAGETIDTGKNRYTMTFPAGQLPPVHAFWSLTMYDGKSQLLSENPINRYLINSPMLPNMKTNEDGSLTLYIQKDNPGADQESNWLPAPNGTVYLVMRLYWPTTEAPSVLPAGKGIWNPPGIVKVN